MGYFLFSGEQHGFRKAANIQRALDAELYFYAVEVFRTGLRFRTCGTEEGLGAARPRPARQPMVRYGFARHSWEDARALPDRQLDARPVFDLGGENSLHFAETAVGVEHLLDAHAVARLLLDLIKIARLLVRPLVGHR